eukprot:TRINITY_DN4419_c0_g1_i3.p2 TRINITY_DN4419_c0_g1~~TRINITY_DN4419_c0_g1_i3.p2  ORF type:complete len:146 (-),score=9.16 TRINITY_DN4419_c0_g1_i3:28-465(-)
MQSLTKLPLTSKMFTPFEIVSIIAEMKWKYYARSIYWREFFLLLILTGLFLADIFWLHYQTVNENTKIIVGNIFNCIMTLILFRFILTEVTQISYSVSEYFKNWSNYIDILFIVSMAGYISTNLVFQFSNDFPVRMFGALGIIFC